MNASCLHPSVRSSSGFWPCSKLLAFMVAIESMSEFRLNYAIGTGAESESESESESKSASQPGTGAGGA